MVAQWVEDDEEEAELPISLKAPHDAPRMARICEMVEAIAANPGQTRKQLAHRYSFSERQVQADLNLIRREMGLPLVRRNGYRFTYEQEAVPQLTLDDVQTLMFVVGAFTQSARGNTTLGDRVRSLVAKLPGLVPPHLRPLLQVGLDSEGCQHPMYAWLTQALLARRYVQLNYPLGSPACGVQNPIVKPQVLFPYGGHWYMVAHCRQRERQMLFPLDSVKSVNAVVQ